MKRCPQPTSQAKHRSLSVCLSVFFFSDRKTESATIQWTTEIMNGQSIQGLAFPSASCVNRILPPECQSREQINMHFLCVNTYKALLHCPPLAALGYPEISLKKTSDSANEDSLTPYNSYYYTQWISKCVFRLLAIGYMYFSASGLENDVISTIRVKALLFFERLTYEWGNLEHFIPLVNWMHLLWNM